MSPDEIRQMYGLANKLARTHKPFWLDRSDTVQEYVLAGWQAAVSPNHISGRDGIHWGYVYRAMYNRFIDILTAARKGSDGKIVAEETGMMNEFNEAGDAVSIVEEVTYNILLPMPPEGEIRETLLALATYPTDCACRKAIGVCINRWTYRVSQARSFVENNMA